jgi:hypothetical protein
LPAIALSCSGYGGITMKKRFIDIRSTALRALVGSFALLALLAFALPQAAQAATSGGAKIYNTVKVTYMSGALASFASANVSVTVNTVAALPTVTNPTGITTVAGALVTYNFKLKSNSNGSDTYTTSSLIDAATGISAATSPSVTASVTLWGGIALGSGAGTITIPNGTQTGLTAGVPGVGSIVQIGLTNQYTVTTITPGTAASTDGSGNLVAEVATTLTLTPIGAAPAILAGSVTAGTQVGEFKANALTVTFTTGTPTVVGTDGTYSTTFTFSTGALPTVLSNTTTAVITTVTYASIVATITKYVRNVSAPSGSGVLYTYNASNYYLTGVTTKPGDILEYILVAANSGSGPVSASVVTDVLPTSYVSFRDNAYGSGKEVTYVSDTNVVTTLSKASDGDQADYNITTPNTLTVYVGTGATNISGGTIPAGKSVLVLYQVTVNN